MYAQIDKPKENKGRAVANSVAQKKGVETQSFEFVDNRPEAVAQRKQQEMANNIPLEKEADVIEEKASSFYENQANKPIQMMSNSVKKIAQLASDYDGVLPAHDTYNQTYGFGPNNQQEDSFTYHHIIPENILVEVKNELDAIENHFVNHGENGQSVRRNDLSQEKDTLINTAKRGWLQTRITNMTHVINTTYRIYDVQVTRDMVSTILTNANDDLQSIFDEFKSLVRPLSKAGYDSKRNSIKGVITEALKGDPLNNALNNQDRAEIEKNLFPPLDTFYFNQNYVVDIIMEGLPHVRKNRHDENFSKAALRNLIVTATKSWSFNNFFENSFFFENSTASDNHLKKIIQRNGLSNDPDDDLEKAVQWNPGNIHRGPSSSKRLDPDAGDGFNELLDDGGNRFEKAAVNLISTGHFAKIVALKNNITQFLLNKVSEAHAPNAQKMNNAKEVVAGLKTVMDEGLTQFDPTKWERHGSQHMRVIADQAKIDTANQRNLL